MNPRVSVYLELFSDREAVHLLTGLMFDERAYGEIRAPAGRARGEIEAQLNAFMDGSLPGRQLNWAIRDYVTDACYGSVQASLDPSGVISIGYRVESQNQNRGVATEAVRQLLAELTLNFPECSVVARPENVSSLRVLAKCDFKLDGDGTSIGRLLTYTPRPGRRFNDESDRDG